MARLTLLSPEDLVARNFQQNAAMRSCARGVRTPFACERITARYKCAGGQSDCGRRFFWDDTQVRGALCKERNLLKTQVNNPPIRLDLNEFAKSPQRLFGAGICMPFGRRSGTALKRQHGRNISEAQ